MTNQKVIDPEPPVSTRLRFGILVLLCCQNAGHALLARFSSSIMKETYSSSEVVFVAEFMKVIASMFLIFSDRADSGTAYFHLPPVNFYLLSLTIIGMTTIDAQGSGGAKLLWLILRAHKIIVLVVLYSIANLLAYYALARVDAAVYTVVLQLKILTTASFSVLLLGRHFSGAKWRALLLLVLGCILVASPAFNKGPQCDSKTGGKSDGTDDEKITTLDAALGIFAILCMVTISGYTAVYFESMLKKEKITVWERNFQLAFYSALFMAGIIVSERSYTANPAPLFEGWTVSACLLATIQAGGGLLVAATLKYADSILKTLATSGSIVLSAVLGYAFIGGVLDIFVSIGCVSTILAIVNYTLDSTPTPSSSSASS